MCRLSDLITARKLSENWTESIATAINANLTTGS